MRKYLSFFRIRFTNGLQYRAAALAGVSTQFAWGFMNLLMYQAFYRANAAAFPMTFVQIANYIWMQQAFLGLFATWAMDMDIFEAIESGALAYEICRPMDLYAMWFVKGIANRVARTVLRCMPILLVAVFLPEPYRLTAPVSAAALGCTVVSMALGLFCVTGYTMLVYISCFYTLNSRGVRMVALAFSDLLSGQLIPLPFFPAGLRQVVELTPFAMILNLPFRIYSGSIAGGELTRSFALQVFWTFALIGIGWSWMKQAVRKVVVQGG